MSNRTGYKFSMARRDVNAPEGKSTIDVLSIAESIAEAVKNIRGMGVKGDLTYIGEGAQVLAEAQKRGIADQNDAAFVD